MDNYLAHRLNLKNNGKAPVKKAFPKISHYSKKRAKQQKEYVKIVKELMKETDMCELQVIGVCTGKSSGLHHMKKRIGFFTDTRYLKRSCTACNQWAEQYPLKAIELGISLSKFTKD